ncbi:hypothetical protein D6745_03175 [Candidatus Woesearchaeota archaeon]|nr:MAG: hypothetical protein D6745_03175 [Candidatus Woesearchaeota archaeon]
MTSLIACLSTGKGTWTEILHLMKAEEWDKVYLITNKFGKEKFSADPKTEFIVTDFNKTVKEIADDVYRQLNGKVSGFEVALNLISGAGKEHMAIMAALIKCGLGFRIVNMGEKGVEEL